MLTIKDVAAAAGVSPTTVSLIINNRAQEKRITQATIDRVTATMRELGYQPNISARRLRTSDVAKPVIAFFWPLDYRSNLLGSFLTGMQKAIQAQGTPCDLMVQPYVNDHLEDSASMITRNTINGAVVGATSGKDQEFLEGIRTQMPIIFINRESQKHSSVRVDNNKVGLHAASLIRQKGYQQVAVMLAERSYMATAKRTTAFLSACRQLGIETRTEWTVSADNSIAGGAIAGAAYCAMEERPAMLFCESDSMAQGALHALHRHGLRLPGDLELLSFSMQADETMEYLVPPVSTVSMPTEKMASVAVSTLLTRIAMGDTSPIDLILEPSINLRESFVL